MLQLGFSPATISHYTIYKLHQEHQTNPHHPKTPNASETVEPKEPNAENAGTIPAPRGATASINDENTMHASTTVRNTTRAANITTQEKVNNVIALLHQRIQRPLGDGLLSPRHERHTACTFQLHRAHGATSLARSPDQLAHTRAPAPGQHGLFLEVLLKPFPWTRPVVFKQVFEIRAGSATACHACSAGDVER
jgi:hypothetical protein